MKNEEGWEQGSNDVAGATSNKNDRKTKQNMLNQSSVLNLVRADYNYSVSSIDIVLHVLIKWCIILNAFLLKNAVLLKRNAIMHHILQGML